MNCVISAAVQAAAASHTLILKSVVALSPELKEAGAAAETTATTAYHSF